MHRTESQGFEANELSTIQETLQTKESLQTNIRQQIRGLTLEELTQQLQAMGEKPFRAKQIYEWIHKKQVKDFSQMTNLSGSLREKLQEHYELSTLKILTVQESKIDGTRKYLIGLQDGNCVEAVWMRYHHGVSVCISSQVGCRMGCRFCASTLGGLVRNLTAAELVEEISLLTEAGGERIANIVIMGIGEPMDNYDAVVRFIRLITDEKGLNISQRSITVSTCGIAEKMHRLAEEGLAVTLALSLHAVTDEARREIMPVANRYSIAELMEACDDYFDKTGRRISFEYALIAGVNDREEDVRGLARLAAPRHCHVNLIPVNPVTERGFQEPDRRAVEAFCEKLKEKHVNATIRRELGRDIDGACGQLRGRAVRGELGEENP